MFHVKLFGRADAGIGYSERVFHVKQKIGNL